MNREQLLLELRDKAESALEKKPEDRTYEERYNIWQYEKFTDRLSGYDEGEEVQIFDGEKLANNEIKDGFGNDFPEWFRKIGTFFGRNVKMDDGKIYTLIGVSYTYSDYYYLVERNGKKSGWSCVGKIEIL